MTDIKFPQWILSDDDVTLAASKGYNYSENTGRFMLKRSADDARIWPHVDGFLSCFIRQGQYVKHQKYVDLGRALDRRFGD